ncbi:MAG TPA: DUF2604 domain-containing protein, partial [Cyclobacteriaceae bacterium]|nr:DUF2604 domain-containing protein [Cyclobacteriaceae bacterium]
MEVTIKKQIMAKEEKDQFIVLNFRIQSETVTVEKVNVHQPLAVAVQKALKDHDQGRPIQDWIVTYNGEQLDISKKVQDLG